MNSDLKSKAIDWFVRLRAPDAGAQERDAHDEWLAEDPAHRAAEAAIETEWRNLDGLSAWAKSELQRLESAEVPSRRLQVNYWLMGFATASAAALVAFVLWSVLAPTTSSEHIATAKGEQRRVVLEDGSRIHLNSSSTVDVRFSRQQREVRLIEGEGLFDVTHDPGRPFVVQVPGSKVVAVGTRFNVYFVNDELAVTVLEGKVMVVPDKLSLTKRPESEALLVPNQQAHIDLTGAIGAIQTVDATRLTSWDNGLLIFDNTPLREVAAEISRYVSGTIEIAAGVPNYPVTGTIKIRDRETMLRVLSEVAPVIPVQSTATVTTLMHSPGQALRDDSR
jgi:transmembrane sensor